MAAVPGSLVIRRALTDDTRREPRQSGPAPTFTLPATDGTTFSSASLAGRPAIVHFFASWCEPCRSGLSSLAGTRRRHPEVAVVGIVVRDDPAAAGEAFRSSGAPWPLLLDPDEQAAKGFGVDSAPVTFFVSADGDITGRLIGPISSLLIDRQLKRIL